MISSKLKLILAFSSILALSKVAPYATASSGFIVLFIFIGPKILPKKFFIPGILVAPPTKITSSI